MSSRKLPPAPQLREFRELPRAQAQDGAATVAFRERPARFADVVTAVETHFYGPDLPNDVREILRVLKPGGRLVLIVEAYKGGKKARAIQAFADAMAPLGYSHLDVAEHRDLLVNAGYAAVEVIEDYERGWLCTMGTRP